MSNNTTDEKPTTKGREAHDVGDETYDGTPAASMENAMAAATALLDGKPVDTYIDGAYDAETEVVESTLGLLYAILEKNEAVQEAAEQAVLTTNIAITKLEEEEEAASHYTTAPTITEVNGTQLGNTNSVVDPTWFTITFSEAMNTSSVLSITSDNYKFAIITDAADNGWETDAFGKMWVNVKSLSNLYNTAGAIILTLTGFIDANGNALTANTLSITSTVVPPDTTPAEYQTTAEEAAGEEAGPTEGEGASEVASNMKNLKVIESSSGNDDKRKFTITFTPVKDIVMGGTENNRIMFTGLMNLDCILCDGNYDKVAKVYTDECTIGYPLETPNKIEEEYSRAGFRIRYRGYKYIQSDNTYKKTPEIEIDYWKPTSADQEVSPSFTFTAGKELQIKFTIDAPFKKTRLNTSPYQNLEGNKIGVQILVNNENLDNTWIKKTYSIQETTLGTYFKGRAPNTNDPYPTVGLSSEEAGETATLVPRITITTTENTGEISVGFSNATSSTDWISISNNISGENWPWYYLNGKKTPPPDVVVNGSLTFDVSNLGAGSYTVYLKNDEFIPQTSSSLTLPLARGKKRGQTASKTDEIMAELESLLAKLKELHEKI
jgi:hypothetical protein